MIFQKKPLTLYLAAGTGIGSTRLSAFDAALHDAGVFNYNLIILSSVIPAHAEIKEAKFHTKPGEHGNKLYCVLAEIRSDQVGKYIGAALGWYQTEDDKRGIFVEFMEKGKTYKQVEENLHKSVIDTLTEMCKSRNYKFTNDSFRIKTSIAKVEKDPTSALVIAVYKTEGWS